MCSREAFPACAPSRTGSKQSKINRNNMQMQTVNVLQSLGGIASPESNNYISILSELFWYNKTKSYKIHLKLNILKLYFIFG